MNRIYRTLWSVATQSWQAVPETAKSAGKKSQSSAGGVLASVALGLILVSGANAQAPPAANQLPTGGSVARGTATISQTATAQAAAMTVNQASQRAVVNWNTFNVGSNASVNFVQPNAQAVTLNRVNDSNPSQIFGRITANGQVFLTNANGVYFSPSSSVDVGALTATTHSITDDNFMSGRYVFDRNGATSKVVNEGNITAALGGYVALLAPEVQNAGVVVARAGMVALAAGEAITLNIDGSGSLAGITTTPSAIASLVENKLAVLAPYGQIILSAVALDKLQMGLIKNSGTLEANSLVSKGGKIILEADDIVMDRNGKIEAKGRTGGGIVLVGGDWQGSGDLRQATKVTMEAGATIDASATDNGDGGKVVLWSDIHNANSVTQVNGSIKAEAGHNGGNGGKVETSGYTLKVGDSTRVSTRSMQSVSGQWLIDPNDFTVAATGGDITGATLSTNLGGGSVTIASTSGGTLSTTGGSIFVNDTVSFNANTLTLNALNNVTVNNAMALTGTAGLSVVYGQGALASGNASLFAVNTQISIASTGSFSTKLGSDGTLISYTIVNSLGVAADSGASPITLQGMAASANLTKSFVLGSDIDASGTATWNTNAGFTPIGNSTTAFSGKFNGLGHTITGLTIAASGTNYKGLFGNATGSMSNVTLSKFAITGNSYVGALAGYGANFYNIRILGGSVTGSSNVGGMVGYATSTIDTVNTSAAVNGVDAAATPATYIGGLVGVTTAAVINATGTGNVTVTNSTASLATGGIATPTNISVGTIHSIGGLIGQLAPSTTMTLANNINTGSVTVSTAASSCTTFYCIFDVGGLIGTLGGSTSATAANYRVTITDSSTSGNISVSSTTSASMSLNTSRIGIATAGVIGRADNGAGSGLIFNGDLTLTRLSSSGNISGYSGVGGVVGYSRVAGGTTGPNVYSELSATGNITGFGSTTASTLSSSQASSFFNYSGLGGLFAANEGTKSGQIENSHYQGNIVSNGGGYIGGLVGANQGMIVNSYAKGTITMASTPYTDKIAPAAIGGLVGYMGGNAQVTGVTGGSYADVSITLGGTSPLYVGGVGGLVGILANGTAGNRVFIDTAYALGDITLNSPAIVPGSNAYNSVGIGGLVGYGTQSSVLTGTASVQGTTLTVSGNLSSNYLQVGSPVTGPGILPGTYVATLGTGTGGAGTYELNQAQTTGGTTVSGLAITAFVSTYINNSYASGNITATNAMYIGGLAGQTMAVYNSHASGNVRGIRALGGLAGSGMTFYNDYALGNVDAASSPGNNSLIGGLVGSNGLGYSQNADSIANSYYAGQRVNGASGFQVGGLVGVTAGSVYNSYVTGSGQVTGGFKTGGLVGEATSDVSGITNSYSTVNVTGSYNTGGLVGILGKTNNLLTVSSSWSSGNVSGLYSVGGLIGLSYGTVNDSYATGAVTSSGSLAGNGVGGLVGTNLAAGSVRNSFATGSVTSTLTTLTSGTGSSDYTVYAGGLIGYNQSSGSVNNSYASGNVTINNTGVAGGLIGYTAIPVLNTTSTVTGATISGSTLSIGNSGSATPDFSTLGVGSVVSGTGITQGTVVTGFGTGKGASGTYSLNQTTTGTTSTIITNATSSDTASISGNILTLGGAVSGYFAVGTVITGTGIPANTYITGIQSTANTLLNGFGGSGSKYTLSNSATFSGAVTGTNVALSTYTKIPVAGFMVFESGWAVGGGFAVGMAVTGPNIPAGTTITGYTTKTINGATTAGYTLSDTTYSTTSPIAVVGQLVSPNISNVYATGNVTNNKAYGSYYSYLGGLIGQVASAVPASIANAYASGTVSAPVTAKVSSPVTDSLTVTLSFTNWTGGGVKQGAVVSGTGVPVGTTVTNVSGSTVTLSNSVTLTTNQILSLTSRPTGTVIQGGVIGIVDSSNSSVATTGTAVAPTLTNLYFNSTSNSGFYGVGNDWVNGTSLSSGVTGVSSSDLRSTSALSGLIFSTTTKGSAASGVGTAGNYWVLVDGDGTYNNAASAVGVTYPMLASEWNLKVSSGHQLQLMGLSPGSSYVLQNSIKFGSSDVWSSTGFVPVGTSTNPFTGHFTGSALFSGSQSICPAYTGGCTISDLTINSNWTDPVGLFGTVSSAGVISGVRLLNATVSGAGTVGAVVGSNAGNLTFSSSSGSVTSSNTSTTAYFVGGIAGQNTGTMDRVFSTATVTGNGLGASNMLVGGVVGDNNGASSTLSNAYASGTGTLRSGGFAGGLAGANSGTISNSYAAEPVYGTSTVSGGLVGNNANGTLTNNFWDTTTTTQAAAVASGGLAGTLNNNAGMVTAQMQTLANYNSSTTANGNHNPGWDLTSVWNPPVATALYPALRDFLIPITVTANAITKVYDGTSYTIATGAASVRYSLPNVSLSGDAVYESSMLSDINAGTYTVMPTGLYSNQYNVTFASGTLTITKRLLAFTTDGASAKVYDGTTAMDPSNITINNLVGLQTLTITSVDAVSALVSANASNYINSITLADGTNGGLLANYSAPTTLTRSNAPVTITAKSVTVSGVNASNKEYDGTTTASVSGGVLTGVLAGDSALVSVSSAGTFASPNVADGISISAALSGAASSNYLLTQPTGLSANITAKPVTITDTGYTHIYDGSTYSALAAGTHFSVGALVGSDSVVSVTQTASGTGVTSTGVAQAGSFTVTPSVAVMGTGLASNYSFSYATATNVVSQRPITVTADDKSRVYGDANPALTYTVAADGVGTSRGLVNSDSLGTLSTTAGGTSIVGSYTIDASALANSNYLITTNNGSLVIAPRSVTLTGQMNYSGQPTLDTTQTGTTLSASNVVQGDSLSITGTATLAAATAGTQAITVFSNLSLSNSNYTTTGASGSVNVISTSNINVAPLSNTEVLALIGSQLAGLTASQIASFSNTQLTVFSWQQIAALSPSQFAALTPTQLASLSATQLQGLSAAQLSMLLPAQLSGLTASQLTGFSTSQLQGLTAAQVSALSVMQISQLTPAQIALLMGNGSMSFTLQQLMALTPAQLAGLNPTQVAWFTAEQLSSLSYAQLQALSLQQLAAISPAAFGALSAEQIMSLSLAQVASLTPDQLRGLSPTQIASLSAAEIASFDELQLAAIGMLPSADPTDASQEVVAKYEAPIPAMTEVATPNAPVAEVTAEPAPAVAGATVVQPSVSTVEITPVTTPADTQAHVGVLPVTVLSSTNARPTTTGVAFEQDDNGISLRITAAPPVPPMADKLTFNDKLTSFMVASASGQMVEFQGGLINKRLVIVAPSAAAKQIARSEMIMVLAAAITSLGVENRVVLADLSGVVINLH